MASAAVSYGVWSFVLLILVFGGDLAGCILMSQRRSTTAAFRIRHPTITIMFTLTLALFLAVKNFVTQVFPEKSYLLWDVIASVNLAGFCPSLYFIRTWKIVFDSETLSARSRRSIVAHSWYLSHQTAGSEDLLFWAVLVSFALHNIAGVIIAAAGNVIFSTAADGYTLTESKAGIAAFVSVIFYTIASFVLGLRVGVAIPSSETYFWLRIEICASLFAVAVFACVWFAMTINGRTSDALIFLNLVCALVLVSNVVVTIIGSSRDGKQARMFNSSNPTPLRKTVQSRQSATSPAKEADLERLRNKYNAGIHLRELFEETELMEKFRQFLEAEFSSENLLFLEDVVRFRHLCKDAPESRVKEKSKVVFDKYLAKNAPYQINLDSSIIHDLRTVYFAGNATATMFDEAEKEILDLLEKDAFRRFLQSLNFKYMSMSESRLSGV
jgi:hypothetical protein